MKTYIKILGVSALAVGLLAFKKKRDYSQVIEKMTWDIADISNLRTKWIENKFRLFFDMDVAFHNNTPFDFDFDTAGYILLRKINVLYKGKLFGAATSNTSKFAMPPHGNFLIENIQVEMIVAELIAQLTTVGLDTNPANYTLQLQVEALGQTFLIDQPITI